MLNGPTTTQSKIEQTCYLRIEPEGGYGDHVYNIPMTAVKASELSSTRLNLGTGKVMQENRYRFQILLPEAEETDFAFATLTVNGKDLRFTRSHSACTSSLIRNVAMKGFPLVQEGNDLPFGLVCGFARIKVSLLDERNTLIAQFLTQDIQCEQSSPVNAEHVEKMVGILATDPADDPILQWMTCGNKPTTGIYSLIEGGYERGAERSPSTYLTLIEEGLNAAEAMLPLLHSHAAGRMQHQQRLMKCSEVRRMGVEEIRWVASHPESLRPLQGNGPAIMFRGRKYIPQHISTTHTSRTLNVYENQLCLAYLQAIADDLSDFARKAQEDQSAFNPAISTGQNKDGGKTLLTVALRKLQNRQDEHAKRAAGLRIRALRLLQLFRHALPDAESINLRNMPLKRTKIFKEIHAYSQMYLHIERYRTSGESIQKPGGLAIAALQLDRIYETYVLYRMLNWLRENNFRPSSNHASIAAVQYGYASEVFADLPHVSNVYHLVRNRTKVSLYYEPVIFADAREMHGLTLHRLAKGARGVYTPDFVIVVKNEDQQGGLLKSVFVLDAKYRPMKNLTKQYGDVRTGITSSEFDTCAEKYLANIVDAETRKIPDGLWLLSGIKGEEPEISPIAPFPWYALHEPQKMSGICAVTPESNLTSLFSALGINPLNSVETPVVPTVRKQREILQGNVEETALTDKSAPGKPFAFQTPNPALPLANDWAPKPAFPLASDQEPKQDVQNFSASSESETAKQSLGEPASEDRTVASSAEARENEQEVLPPETKHARKASNTHANRAEEAKARAKQAKDKNKKKEEKKARRKAERANVSSTGKKEEQASETGFKVATHKDDINAMSVEECVHEIVETTIEENAEMLYDSPWCFSEMRLNCALLRKRAGKQYTRLPGSENIYYFNSRLPSYRANLQKYIRTKLRQKPETPHNATGNL